MNAISNHRRHFSKWKAAARNVMRVRPSFVSECLSEKAVRLTACKRRRFNYWFRVVKHHYHKLV
jgi:hypothetical protein